VPSFGPLGAQLLIVGLAPGLRGANRTGRPFTGDYAGDLLYETLTYFGLAQGSYNRDITDDLALSDCRITNAVRCVPPKNRPTTEEIKKCRSFLRSEIQAMARLRAIVALGTIAHDSVLSSFELRRSKYKFSHGQMHTLDPSLVLFDSYHCSRYNTNTGRLTSKMFSAVFRNVCGFLHTPIR